MVYENSYVTCTYRSLKISKSKNAEQKPKTFGKVVERFTAAELEEIGSAHLPPSISASELDWRRLIEKQKERLEKRKQNPRFTERNSSSSCRIRNPKRDVRE